MGVTCGIDDNKRELKQAQDIGTLKSEVHTLNTLVTKLYEKFDLLFDRLQAKPIGVNNIIMSIGAILTIFALLFGSVIYIANSSNAPLMAQMQQINMSIKAISGSAVQNNSLIQLSNQRLSGIDNKVVSNEETLKWLLFDENIPKEITKNNGRIIMLERQMDRVIQQAHHKGK